MLGGMVFEPGSPARDEAPSLVLCVAYGWLIVSKKEEILEVFLVLMWLLDREENLSRA